MPTIVPQTFRVGKMVLVTDRRWVGEQVYSLQRRKGHEEEKEKKGASREALGQPFRPSFVSFVPLW
jgi:hypothetical protein